MSEIFHWPLSNGDEVCLYADHVAAVAEADRRGRNAAWADEASTYREHHQNGYADGQRDERERILDGVMNFYAVAPKAADPMVRIIEQGWDGKHRKEDA